MQLNPEQEAIVAAAVAGHNIIINAVAGAGKTATALAIARALPERTILQVTYNRKLKQEVRKKVKNAGITNMIVSNYHSLCLDYYGSHEDTGLQEVAEGLRPAIVVATPPFETVIIDEAQDMTPEYYNFLQVFITQQCIASCQLIVAGDVRQSVYDFKGANHEYLSEADKYWGRDFVRLGIATSFRVPPEVTRVVNALANEEVIRAAKPATGIPVTLLTNYYGRCPAELLEVFEELVDGTLQPSDVMIILPSAEANCATSFINRLSSKIPIYKQMDDTDSSEERYTRNKVLVCTYHTSKGLERDTVILFNFDASYFVYYQPDKPQKLISTLYVGLTRALRRLYIVETNTRLSFIPVSLLNELRLGKSCGEPRPLKPPERVELSVWKLCKFLPSSLEYTLAPVVRRLFTTTVEAGVLVVPQKDVRNKYGMREYVADITARGIIEYFVSVRTGTLAASELFLEGFDGSTHISVEYVEEQLVNIRDRRRRCSSENLYTTYLRMIALAAACRTGHLYRYRQLIYYNWMTREELLVLLGRLACIPSTAVYHVYLGRTDYGLNIHGEFDAVVDNDLLVSIESVEELGFIHLLRFIVKMWIFRFYHPLAKGLLINTYTGEQRLVTASDEELSEIVEACVAARTQKG